MKRNQANLLKLCKLFALACLKMIRDLIKCQRWLRLDWKWSLLKYKLAHHTGKVFLRRMNKLPGYGLREGPRSWLAIGDHGGQSTRFKIMTLFLQCSKSGFLICP